MANTEIRVGDLVFYLKDISERVYDGTVLAVNEDGTFQIHDETSGGTYKKVPAEVVYTDRNDAEARNQADFNERLNGYLAKISTVADLVTFMFDTDLTVSDIGTDWAARKAAKISTATL